MPEDAAASLPFVPPGAMLTASGRQALSLVAQDLRARGITELLAPTFHCPTMIEPFQLEGLHVELIPVAADFLLDPAALTHALPTRRPAAILHSETAGQLAGPALADTLTQARAAGHVLIVDETHSFLDRPASAPPAADFRIASLRKWLPLPDGAWVMGVRPRTLTRHEIDDAVTSAGLAALAAEAAGENASELWSRAEDLVDRAIQPAAMSPESQHLLAALDVEEFLRRHRAAGSPIPFHWERPRNLPAHIPWPEDQLTDPLQQDRVNCSGVLWWHPVRAVTHDQPEEMADEPSP